MQSADLRDELERVLDSGALRQSAALRRILEYLGDAAVGGKGDLKEYTIGVEALGKSSSYDPQRDSTVRVQVGKLRQKLDEYYREQGAAHEVRIRVPKGAFRLELEATPPRLQELPRSPARGPAFLIPVAACIAIGLIAYVVGARNPAHAVPLPPGANWTPELRLLWQPIVGNGMPIVISYDVAMTVEMPPWKIRNPNINDPEELAASAEWQDFSARLGHRAVRTDYPYVGFGIAQGAFLLGQLLAGQKSPPLVKRSSSLSWEDIAHSNLVFIGSGENAKIRFILQHGEFRWDPAKITNLKPQPGEPAEFRAAADSRTGEYREQYGLISLLPGFDENTRVLVLGGGISEADWAAVQYVTSPDGAADLVRRLKTQSGDVPRAFQVVARIKYDSRVPVSINYVTHHVLSIPGGLRRESEPK